MNWEERKANAAERKRELAARLDSNELLIAGLRFYLGILTPGRPVAASLARARTKTLKSKTKLDLWAARRVLGIEFKDRGRTMRLPLNYWRRLLAIGLQWNDFDEREEFELLNTNLVIDEAVRAFALSHPILEAVREFLRGPEPTKPTFPRPQLDAYGEHLERHFMQNVREHLSFLRE